MNCQRVHVPLRIIIEYLCTVLEQLNCTDTVHVHVVGKINNIVLYLRKFTCKFTLTCTYNIVVSGVCFPLHVQSEYRIGMSYIAEKKVFIMY